MAMKERTIKVYCQANGKSNYPEIRLAGKWLYDNGFEVGVHGLNHDGKLFFSRKIFNERAKRINFNCRDKQAGHPRPGIITSRTI